MASSFDEMTLPLAKPKKERFAKRQASLGNDDYIIYATNPRGRPLPLLLSDNNVELPEGDDVIALLQSFGYEVEIVRDEGDYNE